MPSPSGPGSFYWKHDQIDLYFVITAVHVELSSSDAMDKELRYLATARFSA